MVAHRAGTFLPILIQSFGFCLYLVFSSFTYWGSLMFLPASFADIDTFWFFTVFFQAGFLSGFILLFMCFRMIPGKMENMPFWTISSLLLGGCALLVSALYLPLPIVPCIAIGSLSLGLSSSILLVCWEHIFTWNRLMYSKVVIVTASLINIIPYLILARLNQEDLLLALVFIIAPTSLILLYLSTRKNGMKRPFAKRHSTTEQNNPKNSDRSGLSLQSFIKREATPLLCVMILGLMQRIVSELSFSISSLEHLVSFGQIGCLIAAVVLFFVWFWLKREVDLKMTYLVLVPLLGAGLIFWAFFPVIDAFVIVLISMVFCLISMLVMIAAAKRAQETNEDIGTLYACYAFVLYCSLIAGKGIGAAITLFGNQQLQVTMAAFALIYVLSLVLVIVARNSTKQHETPDSGVSNDFGKSLHEKLARCTGQYHLTARESEIIVFMAQGRSAVNIAKQLYISQNTVRTYQKSIYRKFDVHNKQELLDIVSQ